MNVIKMAAFADGQAGGNPAGVVLGETLPTAEEMQTIAADVGFSETVFAAKQADQASWRVRYFSPESEVPFCGHATIALGAALAKAHGDGAFNLILNDANISVNGKREGHNYIAVLQSPATRYTLINDTEIDATLSLFDYRRSQLSHAIAPARIHAGADHYLIVLKSRSDLAAMAYDLNAGRDFMRARNLVTIMFAFAESDHIFHVRNAFASGGVLEDPATGAAAAAFSAYLRDSGSTAQNKIEIVQGEDMGARSLITAEFDSVTSSSIRVSGATRDLS